MAPSMITTRSAATLKRKHDDADDEPTAQQPRKLAARPGSKSTALRQATNLGKAPPALTQPRAPSFTKPKVTRATSAPPVKPASTSALGRSTTTRPAPARPTAGNARAAGARVPSSSFQPSLAPVSEDHIKLFRDDFKGFQDQMAANMDIERARMAKLEETQLALTRELAASKSVELTRRKEQDDEHDAIVELKRKHVVEMEGLENTLRVKNRDLNEKDDKIHHLEKKLEGERNHAETLQATIGQMSSTHVEAEAQKNMLNAQISTLHSSLDAERAVSAQLRLDIKNMQKRIDTLDLERIEHESIRRKMHNIIQELKGNIRVFCRVRPVLSSDLPAQYTTLTSEVERQRIRDANVASMDYPDTRDQREIVLSGMSESATGQERKETWNFQFDRVFEPGSTQAEVFEEVSQLAQSVTDGYNVCIFAYGQTGSGKSFTMEGGISETTMGMIPRAVDQVFRVAEDLQTKGWEYRMEGQFLEIYNETVNDLLGHGELDKKKHEIKHDKGATRVTDVNVIPLASPAQVRTLLALAQSRRTVAATLMNERSSRSHSVFTLRVTGANARTGESCDGCLNLVDLAGSERLNASGAGSDKDRLRETQNINRSLSALGDVIAALGEKGEKGDKHIPYRNSKLTYLLQNSLSGSSKTLMILNVSPLASSLGESLCSLRFATKVNNTTIGTAKKQIRSSPSTS